IVDTGDRVVEDAVAVATGLDSLPLVGVIGDPPGPVDVEPGHLDKVAPGLEVNPGVGLDVGRVDDHGPGRGGRVGLDGDRGAGRPGDRAVDRGAGRVPSDDEPRVVS